MIRVTLDKRTTKLAESTNIKKAIAMHWRKGMWGAVILVSMLGTTKIRSNLHTGICWQRSLWPQPGTGADQNTKTILEDIWSWIVIKEMTPFKATKRWNSLEKLYHAILTSPHQWNQRGLEPHCCFLGSPDINKSPCEAVKNGVVDSLYTPVV